MEDSNPESSLRDRTKKNRSWGSRDRRFLSSLVYGIIRSMRMYVHTLNKRPTTIDDFYQIIGIYLIDQEIDLPDWERFDELSKDDILEQLQQAKKIRHHRFSIPTWLDELGSSTYLDQWEDLLNDLDKQAPVFIRVNASKSSLTSLVDDLQKLGITAYPINDTRYKSALRIETKSRLTSLSSYHKGFFEIQDLSSQLIAPFMELRPGMTVVDACAGAGGKTLHIADLLKQKGKIHCFDIHAIKLKNLQKRTNRTGLRIHQTHLATKITHWDSFDQVADRVLIDAPCTGLGTIRRKPILKWRLNERWYATIRESQQQVLQQYAPMCKKGGLLIYATCSILPTENNEQVHHFLQTPVGKSFELLEDQQILPSEWGGDGFYMAKLRRHDH